MGRKPRIKKPLGVRLAECEDHLFFLWDARRQYPTLKERYKQVVAELRVLVADHSPDRRLLLAMMRSFGFEYSVQPPDPPFEKQPIPMVGWRDDPRHLALTAEIASALGDEAKLAAALAKQAELRRPVPLDEYVERGLAIYIKPYDYSFRALILSVAQQIGSSHEDTAIDVPLAQLHNIRIGGAESFIPPLIQLADLVLTVGTEFLLHVRDNHGYELRHFSVEASG